MLCGVVADHLGLESREDIRERRVADVHFEELGLGVDVSTAAAAMRPKRVDDSDIMTGADQRVDDV